MLTNLILGVVLVLTGRKIFWLSVGIIGFLIGMHFGAELFPQSDPMVALGFAVLFGVLGSVLAVAFEWFAVVLVVGYMGGGYVLTDALLKHSITTPIPAEYSWVLFVIGGVIGMIVVIAAFDWALIILTSVIGMTFIVEALNIQPPVRELVFLGGCALGILVQYLTSRDVNEENQTKVYREA